MPDATGQIVIDFSQATRKTHPNTSRIAEEKITKSGKRQSHCDIILNALRQHNGSTTAELAATDVLKGVLTYRQIWKRMNDLVENEYIKRNDAITREGHATWWIL